MRKWINAKVLEYQKLKEKQGEYKYAKWIIPVHNTYKALWDVFCMILVLYVALVVPFRLGFGMDDTRPFKAVRTFIDVIFVIDIVLSFCTEVEHDTTGRTISTHREIALNYLKGWLLLDLVTVFPFEIFNLGGENDHSHVNQSLRIIRITKLSRLIRLMRLARIMKAVKKFDAH